MPTADRQVCVDIAQMTRTTRSLSSLDPTALEESSAALLTAFVSLGAACQIAGHKPSWFDAQALASS